MDVYIESFLPLFVAINLPGILPLFIGLTDGMTAQARRRVALQAVLSAFAVALLILLAGQVIFATLGITVHDLRVGGGLILLILSITDLIFSDYKQRRVSDGDDPGDDEAAGIVPLGIPLTIGPAAITTILVAQQRFGYLPTLTSMVLNLTLVMLAFFFGPRLMALLGRGASKAVAKVASLFLAAIAVSMIHAGIVGMISAG